MSDLKSREHLKPFCPIHHWRMSHDTGSNKVKSSYRCNFDSCTVRYTVADGYFEADKAPRDYAFLATLEPVACHKNREHNPAIIGYAKESFGGQTQEWRHWQCLADDCEFSLRQKLSVVESQRRKSSNFIPASAQTHQFDFASRR